MAGAISLLVESPLQDLAIAMRGVPADMKRQISRATKSEAKPIWFEEVRDRATTRIQQRVLVGTADVSVTARNVTLTSARRGKLSSGTPAPALAWAAEKGMRPDRPIKQRSRKGKTYTRRAGSAFGPAASRGNVVAPAASDSIPRFASLWAQTAVRCIYEAAEKVN